MFSFIKNDKTVTELENAVILCNEEKILQIKTYKEVLHLSNKVTKFLENITDSNICLALFMNHNVYLPSIILSIQKSQLAFVFLTVKNVDKTITKLKLNWILSLNDIEEITNFEKVQRLQISENDNLVLWQKKTTVYRDFDYRNIFCVIQTSGTTGENKMIRVPHTCLETNTNALRNTFGLNSKDIIYWGTPLTFDPSMVELLLALQSRACLLIVSYKVSLNPYYLYKALINRATVLQMVPSVFLRWREPQIKEILNSRLRILAFGGENFPKSVLNYKRSGDLRIFNLYGISEISCWATIHEIDNKMNYDEIPVGECLEETFLELRDEENKVVNFGEGEIIISSSSRICYVDNEKTEDNGKPVLRKTGDIARICEKGIFLVGRKNKIIKRFGHRINLTKTESLIFQFTSLESRCIWSSKYNKILTFILIKNLDASIKDKTLDKLRVKLLGILPEEGFPDVIKIVENFPVTPHGKLDEKALEKLYLTSKVILSAEEAFSEIWCNYFGINKEAIDTIIIYTFFEMGGNSIAALQFIAEFEALTDSQYPNEMYRNIFEKSLGECLDCLKQLNPVRKRSGTEIFSPVMKKQKPSENFLRMLWSYDLKACVDGSPLVFSKEHDIFVCVGSFSNIFVVLNGNGGNVYKKTFPDTFECKPVVSPCGNYLFTGCFNGTMYCIDFMKKDIVWEYVTGGKIKNSACFCKDDLAIVFGSYDKYMHCVSVQSGATFWTTFLGGSIASAPISDKAERKIIAATTAGTCLCLTEHSGKILWKYDCGGPVFGTPCFIDSQKGVVVPVVQGSLLCLSLKNGDLLWTFQANGHIFSSLVFYKDCIVFGCHDTNIYIIKASVRDCGIVDKITLNSKISSTPFTCHLNGYNIIVTVCNSGTIYVVDFMTRDMLCSLDLGGEVFSSPFVYKGKVYIGCRDNNIHCVEINLSK